MANAPIERYPAAAVLGTWTMMLDGRALEAERWAEAAATGRKGSIEADVEGARSLARALMCPDGVERMRADAEDGLSLVEPWSPWRPTTLVVSGLASLAEGDDERAARWFVQAIEIASEIGAGIGWALAHAELAILALERGDVDAASDHTAEARRIIDDGNLRGYSLSVISFAAAARVRLVQGDPVRAREGIEEAMSVDPGLTYAVPTLAVQAKVLLARCAMGLGDAPLAESLLADADEVVRHRPVLGVWLDQLSSARAELAVLKTTGMPTLTQAEARLLPLLTTHLSFREIGDQLFVSPHTVKTQAISIYRKLGATSRAEAVDAARQIGLLTSERSDIPIERFIRSGRCGRPACRRRSRCIPSRPERRGVAYRRVLRDLVVNDRLLFARLSAPTRPQTWGVTWIRRPWHWCASPRSWLPTDRRRPSDGRSATRSMPVRTRMRW